MNHELNMLHLPSALLDNLKKARRIFLSVNPVIAFSDVLMTIDKRIATKDHLVDVVSVEKLPNLRHSDTHSAIIACGDMPLKELPSYLRGIIHTDGLQDIIESISASPWLVLRVHLSQCGNHIFEFLASDTLEQPNVNLCDTSWTKFSLLKQRFDKAVLLNGNGDKVRDNAPAHSLLKAVGSDLEFLE